MFGSVFLYVIKYESYWVDLTIKNRKMIIGIISHFSSAAKYARPNLICLSNVISFFYQEYYISSYDVC